MIYSFFRKIYHTLRILVNNNTYDGKTFFPEKKQRSLMSRRWYQIKEIWLSGNEEPHFMLYGMDVKSDEECKEYVNSFNFMKRRDYLNFRGHQHSSSIILRNKFYFGIFAESLGLHTPVNYGYITKEGMLFHIKEKKFIELDELLNDGNHDLFCKIIEGECAIGLMHFRVVRGRIMYKDKEITIQDLRGMTKGNSYLLQEKVCQHPEMAAMHMNSINTIRLITVRSLKDGEIHVWPSHLRTGRGDSEVDNTAAGGVGIGVNYQKDGLNDVGVIKKEHRYVTEHPDSHIKFSEFKIPFLKEAVKQAKYFHTMLPDLHSIGWDVCITEQGPLFIEGNDNWEITTCQACHGGLRKLYNEYFYGI